MNLFHDLVSLGVALWLFYGVVLESWKPHIFTDRRRNPSFLVAGILIRLKDRHDPSGNNAWALTVNPDTSP